MKRNYFLYSIKEREDFNDCVLYCRREVERETDFETAEGITIYMKVVWKYHEQFIVVRYEDDELRIPFISWRFRAYNKYRYFADKIFAKYLKDNFIMEL